MFINFQVKMLRPVLRHQKQQRIRTKIYQLILDPINQSNRLVIKTNNFKINNEHNFLINLFKL